jgi:hypothetical protein
MSHRQVTTRDTHDLDFHDQIRAELLFLASALAVLSTADIEAHAERVAVVLDRLGDATGAVRDAVEAWYDGRPIAKEGGAT